MLKIPGGIPDSLHNRGSDRIGSWRAKVCQMQKGRPPAREIHKRQLEGGVTRRCGGITLHRSAAVYQGKS